MAIPDKYLFSGTPQQLTEILPMAELIYQFLQDFKVSGESSRPLPAYVQGTIYIKLHFYGRIQNTRFEHRVEKRIRLIKDNPATITLDRIMALGNRTKQKFDNFSFTTGQKNYTYNSPEQGFNYVWGSFRDRTEAKRLFEQMLDINNLSPDWSRLTTSLVEEPGERFREPPPKVTQANTLIRIERERPTALVKFERASIKFPHVKNEVDLVYGNQVLSDLNFLKAYQD